MFTEKDALNVIESVFATVDVPEKEDVMAYLGKRRHAIEMKNAAARKRAAEKREKSDAMRETLAGLLGENPITVPELVDVINQDSDVTVTPSMVVSRMTRLVKDGRAEKSAVNVGGRKLVGYTAVQ